MEVAFGKRVSGRVVRQVCRVVIRRFEKMPSQSKSGCPLIFQKNAAWQGPLGA